MDFYMITSNVSDLPHRDSLDFPYYFQEKIHLHHLQLGYHLDLYKRYLDINSLFNNKIPGTGVAQVCPNEPAPATNPPPFPPSRPVQLSYPAPPPPPPTTILLAKLLLDRISDEPPPPPPNCPTDSSAQ
jgi:hypothetical protein